MSDRMTEMFPRISAGPLRSGCQGSVASAGRPRGVSGGRRQMPPWHLLEGAAGEKQSQSRRRGGAYARWPRRVLAPAWPSRTDARGGRCPPRSGPVRAVSSADRTPPAVKPRVCVSAASSLPVRGRGKPPRGRAGSHAEPSGAVDTPPRPRDPPRGLSCDPVKSSQLHRPRGRSSRSVLQMLASSPHRGPSRPTGTVPTGETRNAWATDPARPAFPSGRGLPCQPRAA